MTPPRGVPRAFPKKSAAPRAAFLRRMVSSSTDGRRRGIGRLTAGPTAGAPRSRPRRVDDIRPASAPARQSPLPVPARFRWLIVAAVAIHVEWRLTSHLQHLYLNSIPDHRVGPISRTQPWTIGSLFGKLRGSCHRQRSGPVVAAGASLRHPVLSASKNGRCSRRSSGKAATATGRPGSNWVGGKVPTSADTAVIQDSNVTVTHEQRRQRLGRQYPVPGDRLDAQHRGRTVDRRLDGPHEQQLQPDRRDFLHQVREREVAHALGRHTRRPGGSGPPVAVSGPTSWTGGSISGGGTFRANGGLTLGGDAPNTSYSMEPRRRRDVRKRRPRRNATGYRR